MMIFKDREHRNYRVCDLGGDHFQVERENDGLIFEFLFLR